MAKRLCSVGLDVGTTTTQLIVSELTVENRAGPFSVPDMDITGRKIRYQSPIHFTPLLDDRHMDAEALRRLVLSEYEAAGIRRSDADTGAVIITGETSRKENARAVLDALSDLAGDFVVATAGPHLESVLAAQGAGAVEESRRNGTTILHMDIGGGTANLALITEGQILRTGCLNVGGRLLKFDRDGILIYVSPVLQGLTALKTGQRPALSQVEAVAELLTQALEMAAGLRPSSPLLEALWTTEAGIPWSAPQGAVLSFSGGVADCINHDLPPDRFGDLGPVLGRAIRRSRLCGGEYMLGRETIRATVIGAGCHSAQLSGSTVFHQNIPFPLKNLPVEEVSLEEIGNPDALRRHFYAHDTTPVLALAPMDAPGYGKIAALAEQIAGACDFPVLCLAMEQDMAKSLGQALALRLPPDRPLLCLDRLRMGQGDYLDVAAPIGPALPVVIKTLVFAQRQTQGR